MITGSHTIIYSKNAEADRDFLRDVLKLPNVDVGHGWLIFGLPPSEVAVHPSDGNDQHEFYLLCDDVKVLVRTLAEKRIKCSPIQEERWGSLTKISLPGGGKLGIYQPKHPRPVANANKKNAPSRKPTGQKRRRPSAKSRGRRG